MISFIRSLFRRPVAPTEESVRPNRAARRAIFRMKPGEYQARYNAAALKKAKRKKARGYRNDHVRSREIFQSGVSQGIDMTLRSMRNRLDRPAKRKWLPRIFARHLKLTPQ